MARAVLIAICLVLTSAVIPLARSQPAQFPVPDNGRLLVEISVDNSIHLAGEAIGIQLVLINPTSSVITLEFGSGYWTDYEILSNDAVLYRWSDDKAFTQACWTLTMAPLEVREVSFVHTNSDYPLSPGVYAVHGWVGGSAGDYAALIIVDVLLGLVLRPLSIVLGTGMVVVLVSLAGYAVTKRPAFKLRRP